MNQSKLVSKIFIAFSFIILLNAHEVNAQGVKLVADVVHSNIGFSVSLGGGITRITGKYNDFNIIINYNDSDMTKTTIDATIKSGSISTGAAARDEHLGTPDFFDVGKYPDITFTSDSIRKSTSGYVAYGTFQMHGVISKIELPFLITGKDAEGSVGFSARYIIKRSEYKIGKDSEHPSPNSYVSDNINVEIDFVAKKSKNPAK